MLRRPATNEALGIDVLRFTQAAFERRDKAVGGDGTAVLAFGNPLFLQVVEVTVDGHQRDFKAFGQFLGIDDALFVEKGLDLGTPINGRIGFHGH